MSSGIFMTPHRTTRHALVSSSSTEITAEGLTQDGQHAFVLGGSKAGRLKGRMDFAKFAAELSSFVWGVPLIALLFGTHLFHTIRTGVIQRFLPQAIRISFSRQKEGEGVTTTGSHLDWSSVSGSHG